MPKASKRSSNPDLRQQSSISKSFRPRQKAAPLKPDPNAAPAVRPKDVHLRKTLPEKTPPQAIDENSPKLKALLQKLSNGDTTKFHQENLSVCDKLLRLFDLNADYGPCIGITRLERWDRAQKFGKNPPAEIRTILQAGRKDWTYSVFGQL